MYYIYYDARIADDVATLSKTTQDQIKKAIGEKLASFPEIFGKPLRYSSIGFRSLRVGDYRVIYVIEKSVVNIYFVGHRSVVYKELKKRK